MENIKEILNHKNYINPKGQKRFNESYEIAKEFGDYVGLSPFMVLKLFKKFGRAKVLGLRSFLKDYPADHRGLIGIAYWKLNNHTAEGKNSVVERS